MLVRVVRGYNWEASAPLYIHGALGIEQEESIPGEDSMSQVLA